VVCPHLSTKRGLPHLSNVVFLTGRGHVDVALGLGGEVAGGFGGAGDDVDVATGIELQVTIALYARRELKGGLSPFISSAYRQSRNQFVPRQSGPRHSFCTD